MSTVALLVADIMTPRSRFICAPHGDLGLAHRIADDNEFDAVPLEGPRKVIRSYWCRRAGKPMSIDVMRCVKSQNPLEVVLPALKAQRIQFVVDNAAVVGLVDASDLNRPVARLAVLHPMLQLEAAVLEAIRAKGISEDRQWSALGQTAKEVRGRQRRAEKDDLRLPPLAYAGFPHVLEAAVRLSLLKLTAVEIGAMNEVRPRAAHGAGHLVRNRGTDCHLIASAMASARRCVERLGVSQ